MVAYILAPLGIAVLIDILVLAFGHLAGRHNGREPMDRVSACVVGVAAIGMTLSATLVTWALLWPMVGDALSAPSAFVLAIVAFWTLAAAGAIPTIGLRYVFGDPDRETEQQRRERRVAAMEGDIKRLEEL